MATFWQRLLGRSNQTQQIAQQLTQMQNDVNNLTAYNNQLQALLNINFREQGGFVSFNTINQINIIRNGYNINADVYSIVSDIAQKGASIPLICYEVIDDNALKTYRSVMSQKNIDLNLAYRYKTKALRQVEADNPVQKLIDMPNGIDNATTFYETSIGFVCLCGNNYWWSPMIDMGNDKGKVTEIHIMPSQFTGLIVTQQYPSRVIGYQLIINGVKLIDSPEVIHMKFPNYDYSVDGQQHYGLPPLKAGWNTLGLSNSGETSLTSMFNNGGPQTIITNKTLSADNYGIEQIGKMKKANNDEYSGNTNRGKVKWMIGDIAAIPTGISPVDLDIIAGLEYSFDKLCNLFHVSSALFNSKEASTYNNVQQLIKDSWIRGVLPLRNMHSQSFNRCIVPAYQSKGQKFFVDMDLSGISDLQPDKAVQATWLNTSWWIPPNEKRKIQDIDEIQDPNMDKVYIPSNFVALDDLNIDVASLPNAPALPEDNMNENQDESNVE